MAWSVGFIKSVPVMSGDPALPHRPRALAPAAGAPDGIEAQLHGDLAAILALSDGQGRKQKLPANSMAGSQLSVVAGARNHLYRTKVTALSRR